MQHIPEITSILYWVLPGWQQGSFQPLFHLAHIWDLWYSYFDFSWARQGPPVNFLTDHRTSLEYPRVHRGREDYAEMVMLPQCHSHCAQESQYCKAQGWTISPVSTQFYFINMDINISLRALLEDPDLAPSCAVNVLCDLGWEVGQAFSTAIPYFCMYKLSQQIHFVLLN